MAIIGRPLRDLLNGRAKRDRALRTEQVKRMSADRMAQTGPQLDVLREKTEPEPKGREQPAADRNSTRCRETPDVVQKATDAVSNDSARAAARLEAVALADEEEDGAANGQPVFAFASLRLRRGRRPTQG